MMKEVKLHETGAGTEDGYEACKRKYLAQYGHTESDPG